MKAIATPRQGGKTARMISAMLLNPDAVMVVIHHHERERILGQHSRLKGRVFTFDDFEVRSRGIVRPDTPVFVDNADYFLRRAFGNVTMITYNDDEVGRTLSQGGAR